MNKYETDEPSEEQPSVNITYKMTDKDKEIPLILEGIKVVTLIVLVLGLFVQMSMNCSQKEMLDASIQTLDEMRNYNMTVTRPYVSIKNMYYEIIDGRHYITSIIINGGKTPAYQYRGLSFIGSDTLGLRQLISTNIDDQLRGTLIPEQLRHSGKTREILANEYYIHYMQYQDVNENQYEVIYYTLFREHDGEYEIIQLDNRNTYLYN
jgi:hypothetical protein